MTRITTTPRHLLAATLAPLVALSACGGSGDDSTAVPGSAPADAVSDPAAPVDTVDLVAGSDGVGAESCPRKGEELDDAKLYIEHNATDADTGVHGVLGGEAWRVLCVFHPDGSEMLVADPLGDFDTLALSDLLFESREPENSELPIDAILDWFPEGEYLVSTVGHDDVARVRRALFTHAIPAEPRILSPQLAEDAETADQSVVASDDVTVTWAPATATIDGDPLTVTGYEVIVTLDEHEDPHGNSRPVYDVHVGADVTSLSVPPEFFEPGAVYEVEVLVLEASGNQTIGLGFFRTA